MKALARNTDTQPSHAAAAKMNRNFRAKSQALQVLSLLGKRQQTASQLELRAMKRGVSVDRYAISRRLPELEGEQLVTRNGHCNCPIRGEVMTLWVKV